MADEIIREPSGREPGGERVDGRRMPATEKRTERPKPTKTENEPDGASEPVAVHWAVAAENKFGGVWKDKDGNLCGAQKAVKEYREKVKDGKPTGRWYWYSVKGGKPPHEGE